MIRFSFFLLFLLYSLSSCSSVKTVTIIRDIPPSLNIEHLKKIAVFTIVSKKEDEEKSTKINSIIKNILGRTEKFHIINQLNRKKLSLSMKNLKDIEDPKNIVQVCKRYGIDAIFLTKIRNYKEESFVNTNIESYYSKAENKYITYTIEQTNKIISLDAIFRFYEGREGKILWEKKEDLSISQVTPRSTLFRNKSSQKLLFSLLRKPLLEFIQKITPSKKEIRRKVVWE